MSGTNIFICKSREKTFSHSIYFELTSFFSLSNITQTLSSLTGLTVKAYEVDEHKTILERERRQREATDLLIYAVDEFNNLITSASLIGMKNIALIDKCAVLPNYCTIFSI